MGRPPLTEDQVQAKVEAYCRRYGVVAGPDGLPPFPTGKRETRQHREWLGVYRALQRFRSRSAATDVTQASSGAAEGRGTQQTGCPICSRPVAPGLGVPHARRRAVVPLTLHPACAELVRLAETLGPQAVAAVSRYLWPKRQPAGS